MARSNLKTTRLPQCPGGGEIKTGITGCSCPCSTYHSAPVGARSKRLRVGIPVLGLLTTVPRWGRDQNGLSVWRNALWTLPQCPGGGEIKTLRKRSRPHLPPYHSAPVGARSKRKARSVPKCWRLTTVPRWGRDQNRLPFSSAISNALPQCPGGGEIKTPRQRPPPREAPYHSAPVGARSKRCRCFVGRSFVLPQCPGGGEIKTVW